MWTFDNPPVKLLKAKYGFTPTQEWLDHLRLSSVRLERWRIGFVCERQTDCCSPTTTSREVNFKRTRRREHDYLRDGFYAAHPDKEMKSPDLEVNVLVAMQNVTARVQGAAKGIADEAKASEGTRSGDRRDRKGEQG